MSFFLTNNRYRFNNYVGRTQFHREYTKFVQIEWKEYGLID